jgi:hypothetical protein
VLAATACLLEMAVSTRYGSAGAGSLGRVRHDRSLTLSDRGCKLERDPAPSDGA